jgi:3D (Asp-Asp-Asp) domain-containing protein
MLSRRLDNIGATVEHHEGILYNHIFVVVDIGRFRARGIDPGACHQLLGRSGSKHASTAQRLHAGHCAVDPKRIPYGSKVVFPDCACTAVDTGPAVISRKAARLCGRNASQLKAIVVDRFFETKREAIAWTNTHPHFMTLQVIRPDLTWNHPGAELIENKDRIASTSARGVYD